MKKIFNQKGKGAPQKSLNKAQQELVVKNISFAMNMGKKYAGLGYYKGVLLEDLQQEACYGLCVAALKWNPELRVSFQTYAFTWCLKYIMMIINGQPPSSYGDDDIEDDTEEATFAEKSAVKVEALMTMLNKQEKKVVRLSYGIGMSSSAKVCREPMTIKEVAKEMHLQVARVHIIYEKAMAKMEFYNDNRNEN